jgi:hypothetical protein
MLDTTLATTYVPGTNLINDLGSADWRYLLPNLELDIVVCMGALSMNVLRVLSTIGKRIVVVSEDERELRNIIQQASDRQLNNVFAVKVRDRIHLPFQHHSVQIIHVQSLPGDKKRLHDPAFLKELKTILRTDGILCFEIQNKGAGIIHGRLARRLCRLGLDASKAFWLTPLTGDFQTASPLYDRDIAVYFFKNLLYGQSLKKQVLSLIGQMLSKCGVMGYLWPHRAIVAKSSAPGPQNAKVPDYIAALAGQAGVDLTRYRFGLSARGKNNANKLIFFLFHEDETKPRLVVKMTRSHDFNYRLENEFKVLQELSRSGLVNQASFPKPIFFGYHKNLALLGLEAVDGSPFRTRTTAAPSCPIARKAVEWICRLGPSSESQQVVPSKDVSQALHDLFRRFNRIYRLPDSERQFLHEQIDVIANIDVGFPLVVQHGDPGTWNILVSQQNHVIFIDWEAGELKGMPLWDLFYFMRSFASWVSRTQGKDDALKNFSEHFLTASELNYLLIDLTERYCSEIRLDKTLVKPLFYTCWMHRALKESTRLSQDSLQYGTFINLLKLCIEQRHTLALSALFFER